MQKELEAVISYTGDGAEPMNYDYWSSRLGIEKITPLHNEQVDSRDENKMGNDLTVAENDVPLGLTNNLEDGISERISQGEHGAKAKEDGGVEELANRLRGGSGTPQGDTAEVEDSGRNISRQEKKDEDARIAVAYAKEAGVWYPNIYDLGEPFSGGNENTVVVNKDEDVVYKINNLMNSQTVSDLLDRVKIHNEIFPDTRYEFVGISGADFGKRAHAEPVFKQRLIKDAVEASYDDIYDYMGKLGFRQVSDFVYRNGVYEVSDMRPRNVLRDKDGDIYVIDAGCRRLSERERYEGMNEDERNRYLLDIANSSNGDGMERSKRLSTVDEVKGYASYKSLKKGLNKRLDELEQTGETDYDKYLRIQADVIPSVKREIASVDAAMRELEGKYGAANLVPEIASYKGEKIRTLKELSAIIDKRELGTLREYILRELIGTKLRWTDARNGDGVVSSRGFGKETGWGAGEKRVFQWILSEDGMTPDQFAHSIMESDVNHLLSGMDISDVKNEILSVVGELGERTVTAKRIAEKLVNEWDVQDKAYDEAMREDYLNTRHGEWRQELLNRGIAIDKVADVDGEFKKWLSEREAMDELVPAIDERAERLLDMERAERELRVKADVDGAVTKDAPVEIMPIGKGVFGDIYDQFRGKAKEAIAFLSKLRGGEAIGALHHKDIGDIDLVWGKEGTSSSDGYGLSKLIKYHPEVIDNLQEILSDMHVISKTENRVQMESETHRASIRLTWDNQNKKWLLTAFEKKETSELTNSSTDVESNHNGKQDDTATLLSSDVSDSKDTKVLGETQGEWGESGFVPVAIVENINLSSPKILSEDEYLSSKGYPVSGIGNPALHKGRQKSAKMQNKYVEAQAQKDKEYTQRRAELRKEYQYFVEKGEIAKPSSVDKLIKSAKGLPELESTQAALRALTKRGIKFRDEVLSDGESAVSVTDSIASERDTVNTNPTEAQKEAGNYKKGHVKIDGMDITIENPKGSERSGTDANGKTWSITMNNDYGYILGTKGVDGDHIDMFISDNPESGDVYVVDQINTDGRFDEHKVMYGFMSIDEARDAYLSNYEKGWKGLGAITKVSKTKFKEWIDSSHRKTKHFAEYRMAKENVESIESEGLDSSAEGLDYLSYEHIEAKRVAMVIHKERLADIADMEISDAEREVAYADEVARHKNELAEEDARYRDAVKEQLNVLGAKGDDLLFREVEDVEESTKIVERSKADGTFMKAPNGEPSKLNEHQWVQVRTRAFKEWFGDWEKMARIEKLRNSVPVEISGTEYEGKYELNRSSAKAWIKDSLRGEYVNKDSGDVISLSRKGADKVTSHGMGNDAHLKSIVAIPELVESSIFISELPNEKGNDKYDSYRYYVCGLKINGFDYTVKLTVGVKDGKQYYDHALTEIEKGKLLETISLNGFKTKGDAPELSSTNIKDTKLFSLLQVNSSKVLDANGEPLVTDDVFVRSDVDLRGIYAKRIASVKANVDVVKKIAERKGLIYNSTDFYMDDGVAAVMKNFEEDYGFLFDYLYRNESDPVIRVAMRYGKADDRGMSYNYRDKYFEKGMSVVGRISELNTNVNLYYDAFFGHSPYLVFCGLDLGHIGSDGEMLLSYVKELGANVGEICKSATGNSGAFSSDVADLLLRSGEKEAATSEGTGAVAGMSSSSDSLFSHGAGTPTPPPNTHEKHDAKLQIDADNTKRKVQKIRNEGYTLKDTSTPNAIVRNVGKGLDLSKSLSSNSYYSEFFVGEKRVKLRLSTHPANGARMGTGVFDERISVVVYKDGEHKGGDDVSYDEYTYRLDDKSAQDVVKSIVDGVDSLLSGNGFVADSGIAERVEYRGREAEVFNEVAELSAEFGVGIDVVKDVSGMPDSSAKRAVEKGRNIKGWFDPKSGRVWMYLPNINDAQDSRDTYVHEAIGHKGMRKFLGEKNHNEMLDGVYDMLVADGVAPSPIGVSKSERRRIADEYIAETAESVFGNKADGNILNRWDRIIGAVRDFFRKLFNVKFSAKDVEYLLWRTSRKMKGTDKGVVFEAENISRKSEALKMREAEREKDIEFVNERYNKELSTLTEENANVKIFHLGMPSVILKSSGISNKPLMLYGNKLIKKAKIHNFDPQDIMNLPKSLESPIFVFDGSHKSSYAILTELNIKGNNVLVSIEADKKGEVDFNLISSVFGKEGRGIVNWINNGKILSVDKEKALTYLRTPALIAGATDKQELSSATKIINEFENSNESGEKVRFHIISDNLLRRKIKAGNVVYSTDLDVSGQTPSEYIANTNSRVLLSNKGSNELGNNQIDSVKNESDGIRFREGPRITQLRTKVEDLKRQLEEMKERLRDNKESVALIAKEMNGFIKDKFTELKHGESNFIVALQIYAQPKGYRSSSKINDIRSVYPKDNVQDIVEWINRGDLLKYVDKTKILDWITRRAV